MTLIQVDHSFKKKKLLFKIKWHILLLLLNLCENNVHITSDTVENYATPDLSQIKDTTNSYCILKYGTTDGHEARIRLKLV